MTRRNPLRPHKPPSRRAQLRQGGRLARKVPLAQGKKGTLQRKAIKRAAQMRKRSTHTATFYMKERVPFVRVQLIRYPFCEVTGLGLIDGSTRCTGQTRVVHETWTRARGGRGYLVPRRAATGAMPDRQREVWVQNRRQFLMLCDPCHDWIHRHPKQALETFVVREGVPIRLLRRNLEE